MIPLAHNSRARGFDWRIVQREGDVAIVEQNKTGWTSPTLNVVIIQKHKARNLPTGEMTADAEGLPSWEQWGQQAWTCADKADAKRRFNKLVDDANAPSCEYVSRFTGSEAEKGSLPHSKECELGDNWKDCPACRTNITT